MNPVDIGLRIAQALDSIGIKMGSYIGKSSNIKKAMFGGKPTMFKPRALEALRGTGGNFDDALKLIENEAQFIVNATDAEKMAFLNNVNDYKQFGGPLKQDVVARTDVEQGLGSLKGEIEDLQSSTSDLLTTAKSMKADAEKGLKSAEEDLKVFFETGGNPLKKEDKKFLGGSMHEEGQIRTGIRQFLQNELKNGRIKLDALDTERVLKYFPTLEDDPILVFKKIYGDEAYNKAGSFPGAFEIGEDFNHYRTIFESKMGEDILKVKDKKYVGDGRLLLTESEEIRTPTPDDDDIPFAKGGRAGFAGGGGAKRIVQEIIEYITTKFTPMDAMKEVNKVIGKTGKYKNLKLTDNDINDIVEGSNDFIFQKDPDNLFVKGSIKDRTEYLDDADKAGTFFPKTSINKSVDDMSLEESLTKLEGLGGTKIAERFRLKQKYPGLDDDLLTNIIEDTDSVHKASVLAKIDMAMELGKTNKSAEEIIDILKKEPETKMATGGRAGFDKGGSVIKLLDGTTVQIPAGSYGKYGLKDHIYSSSKGDLTKDEIVPLLVPSGASYATGGRAGFYMGGQSGQSVIEPDLSDIGHGSDALMSRTRLAAPGSQATTSTGLNYLLGEDNDNTRIPFNDGLLVPKPKPYTKNMFEDDSMTLLKGMYGTGKDSNEFLYNEMIKKGNILRNQGVERETVIEIIRNNKDKINAFLETQTRSPKTLKGLAEGGRIGYASKGKVDSADLEALKGLKRARGENEGGLGGLGSLGPMSKESTARAQRNKILDKAIAKFTYAVDNLDQETASYVKSLFNEKLKIGYETTMSGLKQDAFAKTGVVPIDKETIYNAIINLDLPKELKLEMEASGNTAGSEELAFSLSNNKLGITYDNDSQTIVGKYKFDSKDGKTSITPIIQKDQDSQIQSRIEIDKAINGGKIDLDFTKDTTDNSLTTEFDFVKGGNKLEGTNVSGTDNDYITAYGTAEVPLYMLKGDLMLDGSGKPMRNEETGELMYKTTSPYISSEYYKDNDYDSLRSSIGLPFTKNLEASISNISSSDGTNTNQLGLNYKKHINNIFTKNKSLDNRGIFSSSFNMDDQGEKNAMFEIKFPLGGNTTDNIGNMNFDDMYLSRDEKERLERERLENTMYYKNKAYKKDNIYSGNELSGLIEGTKDTFNLSDFIGPKQELSLGGIAGLRQGYVGGGGVNLARRGFLKVLAGTGAAVAAFKSGALKLLGKSTTKAAPKLFTAAEGSGAPAWFEGMVNKVLADGVDITKKAATLDGQTVKSLNTPTGKVDVTIDRTGNIDVNYMGDNTAMGEGVDMRYVVGQADEGTKGVKPLDEFEAVETIPEGQMYSPDDYQVELGENATSNVKNLYSDTSELAELGGQKPLIKEISESIKKRQTLKKINENPDQFASDNLPDYDY